MTQPNGRPASWSRVSWAKRTCCRVPTLIITLAGGLVYRGPLPSLLPESELSTGSTVEKADPRSDPLTVSMSEGQRLCVCMTHSQHDAFIATRGMLMHVTGAARPEN